MTKAGRGKPRPSSPWCVYSAPKIQTHLRRRTEGQWSPKAVYNVQYLRSSASIQLQILVWFGGRENTFIEGGIGVRRGDRKHAK